MADFRRAPSDFVCLRRVVGGERSRVELRCVRRIAGVELGDGHDPLSSHRPRHEGSEVVCLRRHEDGAAQFAGRGTSSSPLAYSPDNRLQVNGKFLLFSAKRSRVLIFK